VELTAARFLGFGSFGVEMHQKSEACSDARQATALLAISSPQQSFDRTAF
jgi:hypothetical protein